MSFNGSLQGFTFVDNKLSFAKKKKNCNLRKHETKWLENMMRSNSELISLFFS